ncbi:MAG: endo alpha-1,4 polygalactosaminidase, partial [Bdellovibrionales bacterium]
MSNPDQIIYAARTYAIEEPAIPLPGVISWFLQLTGALQSRPASIYIVDMYGTDADTIAALKTAGHTVICNLSAGTVVDWYPDSDLFPAAAIGNRVAGGPGEHWIDIRSTEIRSIMLNRIRLASDKGCHGINLDAAESYSNNTGFPLTDANQLDYNQFLAFGAHDRGLILSLNNAAELAAETSQVFDFVIAEQCFQYHECESYLPFIYKNKPVLVAEYGPVSATQCAEAESLKLSLSYLSSHLDGSRYETCQ